MKAATPPLNLDVQAAPTLGDVESVFLNLKIIEALPPVFEADPTMDDYRRLAGAIAAQLSQKLGLPCRLNIVISPQPKP